MARRLNVNINDETANALQSLARSQGVTVTEIVRRAVGTYNFIAEELADRDNSLEIVNAKSNQRTRLALLK